MADELAGLDQAHLRRVLREQPGSGAYFTLEGRRILNLSSNDYLGLTHHPRVLERARAALDQWGAGATASRLICGSLPIHAELEQRLAALKGTETALTFHAGFSANVGIIPALAGRGDHIFADRLAHASIMDGARLSGAHLHRFRHNEVEHLETLLKEGSARHGRRLIVTESVFSMDGDLAPLPDMVALADRYGAMLMTDEAHATGLFGPGGAGLAAHYGLTSRIPICMGTMSKALGASGGFVAGSLLLRDWMVNSARSFVFSTGLAPAVAGAALGALEVLEEHPGMGEECLARAEAFRARLRAGGLDTGASASPIIPILIGRPERALAIAAELREQGILAVAIRPPTVPAGTARLRCSVTLGHASDDLAWAAEVITQTIQKELRS